MIERGDWLKCIQLQAAWWGTIYEPGKTYRVVDVVNYNRTYVDPNKDKEYWSYNQMILKIGQELMKLMGPQKSGFKIEDENKERVEYLRSKTKQLRDRMYEWEIKVELPFCIIKSEMDYSDDSFLITKKSEIMERFGTTNFQTTTYFLEDYFDMTAIYRDNKLKQLGI